MKTKSPLALSATLLIGILIGHQLPRGTPAPVHLSEEGSVTDTLPDAPLRTSRRNMEPATGLGTGGNPSGNHAAPAEPGITDGGMVLVPTNLISELSLAAGTRTAGQELFSRDGRIEEALRITDHEKAVIQTAWKGSLEKIRDLETASMRTEKIDEWSMRVTVPDLGSSMASLGAEFRSEVHRALGGSRSEAFLAAKQTAGMFSPPPGDRSYTVTSESVGDSQWRFRVALEGPGGNRLWVGESIPDELRHLFGDIKLAP